MDFHSILPLKGNLAWREKWHVTPAALWAWPKVPVIEAWQSQTVTVWRVEWGASYNTWIVNVVLVSDSRQISTANRIFCCRIGLTLISVTLLLIGISSFTFILQSSWRQLCMKLESYMKQTFDTNCLKIIRSWHLVAVLVKAAVGDCYISWNLR